ncbi:N-acetylmannosamine-6-phosphate 2-epimerase [Staphylococcus felis]|uniref:N-acetylmannosamine-6-phosphate 2-epimerase n=1 Tax=Staphylococcus felis TaxID=46127 RepID=UPI000E2243B5|nr:N-acetylmannosamine-6-phosphate 2-epimerase [Staphylococcus felis]REH88484.1 N-acetylmannosamine-6-phosphate 2-epimerase [Staphylococcus felis]
MNLPQGLIVSCQALPDEPLYSSFIMSKMALAAKEGGAVGIRANTKEDIIAIKKEVDLPVIGIVKRDYPNSSVFITATRKEIDELIESDCEVIALDATLRKRPDEDLKTLVKYIRQKAPKVEIMADIATIEEAQNADDLGFDYIGTTLYGYTEETKGHLLYENNFQFLTDVLNSVNRKVIAEGNVITPDMLKAVFDKGVYASVVGGAITRPRDITKRFVNMIKEN